MVISKTTQPGGKAVRVKIAGPEFRTEQLNADKISNVIVTRCCRAACDVPPS